MYTRSRIKRISRLFGPIGLMLMAAAPCFSEVIPPERAIEVARAHEANFLARVRTARWSVKNGYGKIPNISDLSDLRFERDPQASTRSTSYVDLAAGRYRYSFSGIVGVRQANGEVSYTNIDVVRINDGQIDLEFTRQTPGREPPPPTAPAHGRISRDRFVEFMDEVGASSGLGWFPPNFWNVRFSKFLEDRHAQGKLFKIESQPDGTWIIHSTPADPHSPPGGSDARLGYDPQRGLVLWEELTGNPDAKIKEWAGKIWHRHVIVWQEIEKGLWVPARFDYLNLAAKIVARIEYHDVVINQPLDEKEFTLEFPIGTQVIDNVGRKLYTVTGQPIDEKQAAQLFIDSTKDATELEEVLRQAKQPFWKNQNYYAKGVLLVVALGLWVGVRHRTARAKPLPERQ